MVTSAEDIWITATLEAFGHLMHAFTETVIAIQQLESFVDVSAQAIPQAPRFAAGAKVASMTFSLTAFLREPTEKGHVRLGADVEIRREGGAWLAEGDVAWFHENEQGQAAALDWEPREQEPPTVERHEQFFESLPDYATSVLAEALRVARAHEAL